MGGLIKSSLYGTHTGFCIASFSPIGHILYSDRGSPLKLRVFLEYGEKIENDFRLHMPFFIVAYNQ